MSSSTESSTKPCVYEANVEALRQVPFFAKLPIGFIKAVAFGCDRKTFRPGSEIFSQGDMDDKAYHIVSGEAELVHLGEGGEELVADFGEGAFLGGLALLGDVKRLFFLRAKTEVEAILVSRSKVHAEMVKTPELFPRFLTSVANTVVKWEESMVARSGGCANCADKIGVSLI